MTTTEPAEEVKKDPVEDAAPAPETKQSAQKVKVTSRATIDFPSIEWGIHAGETLELPVDEAAQKIILASEFITIVK